MVKSAFKLDTTQEKEYIKNLLESYNHNTTNDPEFEHKKELLISYIKELGLKF